MPASRARRFRLPITHPLSACLAVALGFSASDAVVARPSNTLVVSNCQDSGAGSLRGVVASAANGDFVDLTHLSCSRITLASGRIATSLALNLLGPGSARLTIEGNGADRLFEEDASAELALYGMTLTNGYGTPAGGCVYSAGSLLLNDVTVTGCHVIGQGGENLYGGGAFAQGDLSLIATRIVDNEVYSSLGLSLGGGVSALGNLVVSNSTITANIARSGLTNGLVAGGGAYVRGSLEAKYSIISGNAATGVRTAERSEIITGLVGGIGGGVSCAGRAAVQYSTVSDNTAGYAGGLRILGYGATSSSLLFESTISGNRAISGAIGGVFSRTPITVANSTIAFNTEASSHGAGLYEAGYVADLESTIIANNGGGTAPIDVGAGGVDRFTGANNLIMSSGGVTVPSDTIHADPHLLPLTDNGGLTRTHALPAGSVAIDAGNDVEGLPFDQRRAPFARTVGAPDIGAFEYSSDLIFANGFQ